MCNAAYLQMAQVAVGAVGQARQARAVATNARAAEAASLYGLSEQTLQYDQQNTDRMTDRARQAMADVGSLNAIFADANLSGNTQDRIAAVTEGDALRDLTTLDRNTANRANQAQADATAIRARTQSTINSARPPSILGTGLQIAAYGAEAYDKAHPRGA
jgi:hypothetical protein